MTIPGQSKFLIEMIALLLAAIGGHRAGAEPRSPLDPALAAELEEMDRRAEGIRDLSTDFEERKFTGLLKKPLVSQGKLRVVGACSRWDTIKPQPTSMVVDADEIRIYYPQRSTLEVYQIDEKLKWLAISPLPKLSTLVDRFAIERIPVLDIADSESVGSYLGLRLRPRDEAAAKYLRQVDLVLNKSTALIVRVEMLDTDGDRTIFSFFNTHSNKGLADKDLLLSVPAGTQVTRPLAKLEKERPSGSP